MYNPKAAIIKMWEAIRVSGKEISKQDALVAHIWSLVNRRRQNDDEGLVHLDYTIGLWSQVSPQLLPDSIGSPLTQTDIRSSGINMQVSSDVGPEH